MLSPHLWNGANEADKGADKEEDKVGDKVSRMHPSRASAQKSACKQTGNWYVPASIIVETGLIYGENL